MERWNSETSTSVEQEVLGHTLRLVQDPNSRHLGTTVWDASIVLAKFLEKNSRKGDFARARLAGKRCLELGAGMGLAGLAAALLGCRVTLTDVARVLPLLRANVEHNCAALGLPLAHAAPDSNSSDSRQQGAASGLPAAAALRTAAPAAASATQPAIGSAAVAELDWCRPEQYSAGGPGPVDYVLAADCCYEEGLLEHLLAVLLAVTGPRTVVAVANELRSTSVHARFLELFSPHFTMKKVAQTKMDARYQHPNIHIFLLKRRRTAAAAATDGDQEDDA